MFMVKSKVCLYGHFFLRVLIAGIENNLLAFEPLRNRGGLLAKATGDNLDNQSLVVSPGP